MDVVTIPIIVILCSLFAQVIKLFTNNNQKEEQILQTLVPIFGGVLTLILSYIHTDYILKFDSPLVALTIGFISGQSALETKNSFNKIKQNNEFKKTIIQPQTIADDKVVKEVITEEVIKKQG